MVYVEETAHVKPLKTLMPASGLLLEGTALNLSSFALHSTSTLILFLSRFHLPMVLDLQVQFLSRKLFTVLGSVPTDPSKVLTIEITGISGYYNIESDLPGVPGHTILELWLDSLNIAGTAVQAQVEYDWTGDGVVDRAEMYDIFTPNDLPNYELFKYRGLQGQPLGKLVAAPTGPWDNLDNGIVRLRMWSAFNNFAVTYLRSDNAFPGQTSLIHIPFVTAWAYNIDRGCGNISRSTFISLLTFEALVATTGVYTTGVSTTTQVTTTTSASTTGGSSTTTFGTTETTTQPSRYSEQRILYSLS